MKINKWDVINIKNIISVIILIVVYSFLLNYFKPELILSPTTITGGDTVGHYYGAYYYKEHLLPHGKLLGWSPQWFLGYPAFQFYFPLPFLLAGLLGYVIPLTISFKLITVLGSFLLPICAFLSFRFMGYKTPIPSIAAIFTLQFLFLERISKDDIYSMWGGNIPSTLAGEFSYSLGLAFMVLFAGLLYKGIKEDKYWIHNAVVFSLLTLSHGMTSLFAFCISLFFLLTWNRKEFIKNLKYLAKTFSFAFMLLGFWIVPMLTKTGYTIVHPWYFPQSMTKLMFMLFPEPLRGFYILSALSIYLCWRYKDDRCNYLLFGAFLAFGFFIASPILNESGISLFSQLQLVKFLPFLYLFSLMIIIPGIAVLIKHVKLGWLIPLIILIAMCYHVSDNVTYIPNWIKHNYGGYEVKPLWTAYKNANDFLAENDKGRAVFEYAPDDYDRGLGSSRATETMPVFSGRSITEGTHFQSAINGPYIYYAHCEYSIGCSCVFGHMTGGCPGFNIKAATKHLELFNVKHIMASSGKLKNALKNDPNYELIYGPAPLEIYELKTHEGKYVTVPEYEPVLIKTDNWRPVATKWFKDIDLIDIPLVFTKGITERERRRFKFTGSDDLQNLPKHKIDAECEIEESMKGDELTFKTSCPGKPHLIKISYFPNWKVTGADRIYMASPAYMLVFPVKENVKLYYGRTILDYIGTLLSYSAALLLLIYFTPPLNKRAKGLRVYQKFKQKWDEIT